MVAGMPITREPPQIRREYRIHHTDSTEMPSDQFTRSRGHHEHFRVASLDTVLGTNIDNRDRTTVITH